MKKKILVIILILLVITNGIILFFENYYNQLLIISGNTIVEYRNNKLLKIKYGWHDKEGRLHPKIEQQIFAKEYKMQAYNKIEESGYAICWELCELERHFFNKHKIENHTIMAVIKNKKGGSPCHAFTTITIDDQMYWFEAS